ncbi:P-II family nitrogen regulator [Caulobacter segnis]|uniref:P-II family nitrogen regulator n=1 Tax=Caulobacter segnis TaxID=88688 RepID=UPI0024106074|nr:P-II family nitrogen regulator [Caulobacter segnis]MDG2520458.1 P-II family nitrogen regulator [Caulobacter segnis]
MKMITAFIKPFKLEDARAALMDAGAEGLTVSEVRGCGRQLGKTEIHRGEEYKVTFVPKVRLDAVVNDPVVEPALRALRAAAATGRIGDGKVFVTEVVEAMRIRTGEAGAAAL